MSHAEFDVLKSKVTSDESIELWKVGSKDGIDVNGVLAWLEASREAIKAAVNSSGGIVIRGFTCLKDAHDFDAAISVIAPEQLDYVGGTAPRTTVLRRVMTANDLPPRWSIPLHQEMSYTATPPDNISFFCQTAASREGETTVADMRKVLKHVNPAFLAQCREHGVQLRRVMPSHATKHLKPGIQKTWNDVLGTDDPAEAERIVAAKGWRSNWIEGDILHVWQDVIKATKVHPVTREEVWANVAHYWSPACQMTWALEDGRIDDYEEIADARKHRPHMLDSMFFGNGEQIPEQDCLDVFRIHRQAELPLMLQESDMVILDNIHYSHGRRPYEGTRRVLVAMFNKPKVEELAAA
ncbi:TauD/TfdA family dioxygenase [soil metagenome]